MGRLEKIIEEAENGFEEIFEQSCKLIQTELEKSWEGLKQNMADCFKKLLKKAEEKQNEGKKGKVKYILISHLHCSYLSGSYEYRVDLFDENLYLDKEIVYTFFDFPFLAAFLEEDKKKIRKGLEDRFIRLREYEIQAAQWGYQFYYHSLVCEILLHLIEEIDGLDRIQLLFGEYMGKAYSFNRKENSKKAKMEER